jgi:serine/threonine protein kinase
MDVWSFGMVMFCILFGRKPKSFYKVYREWFMRHHGQDVQKANLPFKPPSYSSFIYDPFTIDFENPF